MTMTLRTAAALALVATCPFFAIAATAADDAPVIPDERFEYCTVCHGVQVGGNRNLGAPRLSSLSGWYVERQLLAFKNGWRGMHEDDTGGQEMRPMAAILDADDIARAAAYVDAVSSAAAVPVLDGDAQRGQVLYGSCAACHGADAAGNEALASPALVGLNDWYLLTQLQNYKAGIRGSHADDTYGRQMQAAAALLVDEQAMKDVIRYLSTLNANER